jgi:imidazolonepropionase-like amidohydrolase
VWQSDVAAGVLADLLLVDGNPLDNIKPIENSATNFWPL